MSGTATLFTIGFIFIAMIISLWQKLGLEKDLIIATVRATVQLSVIGFVLRYIFTADRWEYILLMIAISVVVASRNSARRGKGIPQIWIKVFLTIGLVVSFTLGMMLLLEMVKFEAKTIIPISGMLVGNAMVVSSLLLNRLKDNAESMREEILVALSLGANRVQASKRMLISAIRGGMIPIIDSTKTVGLVQLPGMMTGLIIAGTDPVAAVRYQLLVMFSFTASSALVSIFLGMLVVPTLFNQAHQFVGWRKKEVSQSE
ncbi:putative ABC transport system permease protein [Marininema mesophilum]|uniref:Putative ABC transport system permease protein n=1 Tax=Marininema mesophilum TaxID=1048340 RepID=A0A1H2XGI0_9BACL|nr:iron export ABC transporter permease subunit FetB [Marininema mesophilum]SDW91866.1 putative ABC transport system permease protein [Marininema mesophilum]